MNDEKKTKKQLIEELIELRKLIAESQTSITERKQAEEALKEAMAFNESTLNAIDDIFYTFDLSGKMLIWNKAGSRVTGYSDTELSSKKPTDLFLGEDVQRISESIERMWKEGSSKAEANLVLKDGRQVPYEFTGSILKDSKGNIIGFSGIGRDLTERKQAEEALQFTRFSLDNAVDTMVCVDHDGRFIDVNDAFCRSVGYSREELRSMSVHDIDPNYPTEIWPEFWEKLKQGGSLTFESCHRTKKGKVFPVEITANYFEYNGKEYHCSFARDITKRKQTEKEREKLIAELQEALAKVKTLSRLLPICASCKKIRDDKGYWSEIEEYITEHTDTLFSHGMCPDCIKKMYPDFYKKEE